jgi:quinol monooxygenase YgiN
MKDKLYVVAHVVALPGKADSLRKALQALAKHTETEPGFIRYDLHESLEQPGHFALYEIWEDQASLDLHANTDVMKTHRAKTGSWVQSSKVETFKLV